MLIHKLSSLGRTRLIPVQLSEMSRMVRDRLEIGNDS